MMKIISPCSFVSFLFSRPFFDMASVHGLCIMGMHLKTIWGVAKQVHLSMMPFNPVVRIEESPFVNPAGDEVGVQLELYTIHGWEFKGRFFYPNNWIEWHHAEE